MKTLAAALLLSLFTITCATAACVEDDTGAKVCVDGAPIRLISLYGAYSELAWEFGAGGSMVGRTKSDNTIPEMEKLPVVGTGLRPNAEYVLALTPDLVLGRAGKAGNEALTALRERGVRVAAFDPQSLDEYYSMVNRIGVLLGKVKEAEELNSRTRATLSEILRKSGALAKKPKVVYEITNEPLTVAGTDGILNELLEYAGATNAIQIKKRLVRLDAEALLASDPDFYIVQVGPMNVNPPAPSSRAIQAKLTAVAQGRVITVDEKLVSRPGPRVAQAAEELFRLLHP